MKAEVSHPIRSTLLRRRGVAVGGRRAWRCHAGESPRSHAFGTGSAVPASGTARRVLVIDDERAIRLLCRVNLAASGMEVLEADDGRSGLELARRERPDLVLLDVMMPVLDGWGVLDALDHSTAPPIIVFSGFANHDRSPLAMALEKGAIDFLSKPFDMDELVRVVERALGRTKDELEAERQSRLQTL